jgi:hypothetical protein
MMSTKAHGGIAVAVMAVCLGLPSAAQAVSPARLSGTISGQVTNSTGVPQMGATVLLFNKYDRLYEKVLTDERGLFLFSGLLPDIYSIRVTLASFVPAIKSNILVQPGVRSMLNVSLANLFSSIQLIYPKPENRVLMSEDWKWVLRTASETRPVLRLLPASGDAQRRAASVFSDTRGMLRLSSGEGEPSPGYAADPDLGTAFALATSLYGNNVLAVSGKFGYGSQSGIPSAAFRTSFSHDMGGGSPEVAVTMRQTFVSTRLGNAVSGLEGSLPGMRSTTLDFDDRTQLADNVWLRYGFSLDSISFLDRLNYFSPYARLSYEMGDSGMIEMTYTSGNARPDLAGTGRSGSELQRDLSTLTLFPRVSLQGGRARVQRGEDYEISYSRTLGSRVLRVSGYRESVSNAALTVDAPEGVYTSGDILPDVYSGASVFNAGSYESLGYTASLTQNFGEQVSATLMFGSAGALTAARGELVSDNPDDLRAMIRAGRRHAATFRANATLPWSGTQLAGCYQWADRRRMVTPGHLYSTQSMRPEPGLNLYVRQPIPWSPFPWRMEITADLRNLLAQGYLPLTMSGGRKMLLMQTPRAFRGGVSFIF